MKKMESWSSLCEMCSAAEYNVQYPKMPEEEDQGYEAWKARISKELAALDGEVILVGHSVGSSMLLKYLSEEKSKTLLQVSFLSPRPTGELEAGRLMNLHWMKTTPQNSSKRSRFSFTIVVTTISYRSRTLRCM